MGNAMILKRKICEDNWEVDKEVDKLYIAFTVFLQFIHKLFTIRFYSNIIRKQICFRS